MAILNILEFPDPRLRTKAKPVTEFGDKTKTIVRNMLDTMYEANGIGLAATQVNIHQRIIVIDVSEARNQPLFFINPEITVLDEERQRYDEGCLSVPGFQETIERPKLVQVTAQNIEGQAFTVKLDGILAICIQHEIDHLEGKLFVDYISSIKRGNIRKKLEKKHREQNE